LDRPVASRRTPTAEIRGNLVDAAARVLERDGVAGLTVRAVAAEAGVAPMGVYNHFEGKPGLLLAVLQRAFDGLRAAVTVPSSVPAERRLRESGRSYRRFALENPTTYGLMFNRADPSVNAEALGVHALPAFQALVDTVAEGQGLGSIRVGDPVELARQIWSSVHGAVSLELMQNPAGQADADATYEGLLEMIERGVAPDPPVELPNAVLPVKKEGA
jgi:AcrR family transcriptional regulator